MARAEINKPPGGGRKGEQGMDGLSFEWDEAKNQINKRKHGISFETASRIFYDENRIELPDEAHSIEEDRYISIGMVDDILVVIHTDRKDKIRIISARFALKKERSMYYEQFG